MGISKKMQMEEMHRVSIQEYDEDGNPKNAGFDIAELVECTDWLRNNRKKIEKILKKVENDNE